MVKKLLQASQDALLFSKEEREIYEYGYMLLLEMFVNFAVALIIALIMNKISIFISFSILFIPLRSFAGGFHAKSALSCYILSNVILVCVYFINDFLQLKSIDFGCILIYLLLSGIIICKLSPVDSYNKKLTDNERIKYKQIVKYIVLVEIIVQLILTFKQIYIVCIIFFIQVLALIIVKKRDLH